MTNAKFAIGQRVKIIDPKSDNKGKLATVVEINERFGLGFSRDTLKDFDMPPSYTVQGDEPFDYARFKMRRRTSFTEKHLAPKNRLNVEPEHIEAV